jgi:Uri superfamily endonuclease
LTHLAPEGRGTYLLLASLAQPTQVAIGQFGTFSFPTGWYAYAGSALGPGGLPARIARHRRQNKRLHWHIDYLLAHSALAASWEIESTERLECAWASAIGQLPGARLAVVRFGASDCRCSGHLIHFQQRPARRRIEEALRRVSSDRGTLLYHAYQTSTGR